MIEERQKLQKAITETFQKELQTLNPELQSILIDDIVTTFYIRLAFMKKIQHKKETQLPENLEPEWLTDDLKKIFKHEVRILDNGLRVTKLAPKKEKP